MRAGLVQYLSVIPFITDRLLARSTEGGDGEPAGRASFAFAGDVPFDIELLEKCVDRSLALSSVP